MYYTLKQYLKKTCPTFFFKARGMKDQLKIEMHTLRQFGVMRLLKQFFASKAQWKTELLLQSISRVFIKVESLEVLCREHPDFKEGGHTYYFPSHILDKSSFKDLFKYIPSSAGLKVIKREGGIDTPFPASDKTCQSHSALAPSHKELILVHSLFFNENLGPRLYDLVEIQFQNGTVHVAYVLEHIEGQIPSQKECEVFIEKLKTLESRNVMKLVNWNGYKDHDFTCPVCNGNLLKDKTSKTLKYVDLQNFSLGDYYTYLKKIALEAAHTSHFGQKSYLMGGEYLYQEVPGLNIKAKRSPAERFEIFKNLLEKAQVTLKDKLILDVGCNMGLMGAEYLKEGAAWVHGFDMPNVVPHSEKVLLSIGCTRFSLTGLLLGSDVSLVQHLPDNLKNNLEGCVISYLAIRGHIGWVKELSLIPWEFMLYEGHQEENAETSRRFIDELNALKFCHVVVEGWIEDANTTPRYIAIIKSGYASV